MTVDHNLLIHKVDFRAELESLVKRGFKTGGSRVKVDPAPRCRRTLAPDGACEPWLWTLHPWPGRMDEPGIEPGDRRLRNCGRGPPHSPTHTRMARLGDAELTPRAGAPVSAGGRRCSMAGTACHR